MNAKTTTLAAMQNEDATADILIARNVEPPRKAALFANIAEWHILLRADRAAALTHSLRLDTPQDCANA